LPVELWEAVRILAIQERRGFRAVVADALRMYLEWNRSSKRSASGVKRSGIKKPPSDWIVVDAPDLRIVSDEVWQAAADRLAATRATYLRTVEAVECRDGKTRRGLLLGRPRFGNDAKYLLVGLAQCAVCGGGLQVRARFERGEKVLYYECTTRRQRGLAVCSNRLQVRMDAADRAVLSLVETQVFGAGVVHRVMQHLATRLAETGTKATSERAGLEAAAKKLERQQANLVAAIADGGESRLLRAKLTEVEAQLTEVADRLRRLSALVSLQGRDLAQLEAAACAAVMRDWAGLLARHPLQARTIVKKFVQGRFRFEPQGHAYQITATASTALIVGGVVPALLSPSRGNEPDRWWPQRDLADRLVSSKSTSRGWPLPRNRQS
jgi:site-specific DNA recombinase